MDLEYRRFSLGDLEVKFQFDDDNAFQHYKNGEPISAYKVRVKKNGYLVERYFIEIDDVDFNKFNKIVQKFLEDPEYRKTLEKSSEGVIGEILGDWSIPYYGENGINKYCKTQIDFINNIPNGNARFREFVKLKTYGKDKYSLMKLDELIKLAKPNQVDLLKNEFSDEKDLIAALRWLLRGLKMNHVVIKIKVDKEVTDKNKERYNSK